MSPVLQASIREQKKLLVENAKLKNDIAQLRSQLQDKQDKKRRAGTRFLFTTFHNTLFS